MTDKKELRRRTREKIASMSGDYITRSNAGIFSNITALPEFAAAGTVFAYNSVGNEVDTQRIIDLSLELGKRVALPVVLGGGLMEFALVDGADDGFERGQLGIPEPGKDAVRVSPQEGDIVLVPALCYDMDGYRLGQGGGYYDRLLAACPAFSVGLGRQALLMGEAPREVHDLPVKCLVTENGVVKRYKINRHTVV